MYVGKHNPSKYVRNRHRKARKHGLTSLSLKQWIKEHPSAETRAWLDNKAQS